jgi:RNA polymerase sigma-70 factor (ECF subfamily)
LDQREASERFYSVIWPHASTVLRTARILARDAAEADDLAQETMIKAFRSIESFKPGTDARAWLMTILRNTRIDRMRASAASKDTVSLDQLGAEPQASPESAREDAMWEDPESLLEEFSDRQIIAALQQLPEEIRWTLLLVNVEQLDHAEAAAVLDVPVGTIKSRAHRGRAMLRGALAPIAREMRLIRQDRQNPREREPSDG